MEIFLPNEDSNYIYSAKSLLEDLDKLDTYELHMGSENLGKQFGSLIWNLLKTIYVILKELFIAIGKFIKIVVNKLFRDKKTVETNFDRVLKILQTRPEVIDNIKLDNFYSYTDLYKFCDNLILINSILNDTSKLFSIRSHISMLKNLTPEQTGEDLPETSYPLTKIILTSEPNNLLTNLDSIGVDVIKVTYCSDEKTVKSLSLQTEDILKSNKKSFKDNGFTGDNIINLYESKIKFIALDSILMDEISSTVSKLMKYIESIRNSSWVGESGVSLNPNHKIQRVIFMSNNIASLFKIIANVGIINDKVINIFNTINTKILTEG